MNKSAHGADSFMAEIYRARHARAPLQTRKFVRNCRQISTQLTSGQIVELTPDSHTLFCFTDALPISLHSLGFPLSIFLHLVPLGFGAGPDENATANNALQPNRLRGGLLSVGLFYLTLGVSSPLSFYLRPSRSIRWPCFIIIQSTNSLFGTRLKHWFLVTSVTKCDKCDHM